MTLASWPSSGVVGVGLVVDVGVSQAKLLADLQTVQENLGHLEGVRVAWVGDGNNMAHSWIEAASILGFDLVLACPQGYEPNAAILSAAQQSPRSQVRVVTGPGAMVPK